MASWLILAAVMSAQQVPEFHQGVQYTIEAVLDDASHVLHGRERIRLLNKASERLDTVWFHLHLNAFRPNSAWATRELQFNNRRFQDLLGPTITLTNASARCGSAPSRRPSYFRAHPTRRSWRSQ
jgi:hypothetical protein